MRAERACVTVIWFLSLCGLLSSTSRRCVSLPVLFAISGLVLHLEMYAKRISEAVIKFSPPSHTFRKAEAEAAFHRPSALKPATKKTTKTNKQTPQYLFNICVLTLFFTCAQRNLGSSCTLLGVT